MDQSIIEIKDQADVETSQWQNIFLRWKIPTLHFSFESFSFRLQLLKDFDSKKVFWNLISPQAINF